jgi:hypothetical protein
MKSEDDTGVLEKLRAIRDSAMKEMAQVTLAWTSSDAYQAMNAAVSKPALLTAGVFRKASDAAMTDLLAALNIPSRSEVLALSQRLTRIEMALDDLGAGLDEVRRALATRPPQDGPQPRGNRPGRAAARQR